MRRPTIDVHLGSVASPLGEALDVLDADERARVQDFASLSGARRFVAARALLHRVVAEEGRMRGLDLSIVRGCGVCGARDHGAPRVDGAELYVSSSRAGVVVGAALADAGPLGLDLAQTPASEALAELRDVVLSARETAHVAAHEHQARAFAELWARKEAVVKATRVGIGDDLARLDVLDDVVAAPLNDGTTRHVRVVSVQGPAGLAIAVAVVGTAGFGVRVRTSDGP